eukprot:GEMP01040733.1.p1 GENE.GEMP01040733.1~~GEMP01040733.1.p1  ORF type:complete len:347 (+),score=80.36 GEMP01040733.1:113-1153(+)
MPTKDCDVNEGAQKYADAYRARVAANRPTSRTKKESTALKAYRDGKKHTGTFNDISKAMAHDKEGNVNNRKGSPNVLTNDEARRGRVEEKQPTTTVKMQPIPLADVAPRRSRKSSKKSERDPYANGSRSRSAEKQSKTTVKTTLPPQPSTDDEREARADPYANYSEHRARFGKGKEPKPTVKTATAKDEPTAEIPPKMVKVDIEENLLINKILCIVVGLCLTAFSISTMIVLSHLFYPITFAVSCSNAFFGLLIVIVEAPASWKLGGIRPFIFKQLGFLGRPIGRAALYFYIGSLMFCMLPTNIYWMCMYIAMGGVLMICGLIQILHLLACKKQKAEEPASSSDAV